jgi:hypothetical protein
MACSCFSLRHEVPDGVDTLIGFVEDQPEPRESSQSRDKEIPRQSNCRDPRGSASMSLQTVRREHKKGAPWARLFR